MSEPPWNVNRDAATRGHRHHDDALPVDPDLAPNDPGEPSPDHRGGVHLRRSRDRRVLGMIAAGGFLGTWARYELGRAWPAPAGHLPWATLVINTSGALFLGIVLTFLLQGPGPMTYMRPFLCVGFTGSWTTMSTFSLEVDLLVKGGYIAIALGYGALSVCGGIAAAWAGMALARRRVAKGAQWRSP